MFSTVHRNDLLQNLNIANLRAFQNKMELIRKYMTHENFKVVDVSQSVIDGKIYVFLRDHHPYVFSDLVEFNVHFDLNDSDLYENKCYIEED